MDKFRNILNKNLNYFIDSQGIKVSHLANEFGFKQRTVSNYFNNKTVPPIDFLIKFANKFNITVDDLINKDVSDAHFVSENETIYQNKNKDREIELLYKSCELKDKEIELLKKENDLLSRISNEYKKQMDAYMKRISELEKNASGLLEGNKQTK